MTNQNGVILFNPRSATAKYRVPNSILQLGAALEGRFEYVFVDGNREEDPWAIILKLLESGEFSIFACTTMPALQLKQAIPITIKIREQFPNITIIWGGYFATNQHQVVLNSEVVDIVVAGPGDRAFPDLLTALANDTNIETIPNLIFKRDGQIVKTMKEPLLDQDALPPLPYERLHLQYDMGGYLGNTILGSRTVAYHSSVGCPFTCSFCAVVPIYNARWRGKSASLIYRDIAFLKDRFAINGIEFHDNNFFVSEKRVVEFAQLVEKDNIGWWGEARIDTMDKYSDASLRKIRAAGCKMIFFGAETGNDAVLKQMNKGGNQSGDQIRRFAARMAEVDIIPEYSFVLGIPGETEAKVWEQLEADIAFIKEIKSINPQTEIIIYVYSPVPTEGSELYEQVKSSGFSFPTRLKDWIDPRWENFDLRKNPLTPWLTPQMVNRILDFEAVLNAYYPTVSDLKVTGFQRKMMRALSAWRFRSGVYYRPMELRFLQNYWLRYRQPEIEGF